MQFDRLRRREFITLLSGAWSFAAQAQQSERLRRIGVLMAVPENDREYQAFLAAFQATLKVTTNGGDKHVARIAVTEKSKAQTFADQVNTTIAAREDGTNVAPPPAREMTPVAVS